MSSDIRMQDLLAAVTDAIIAEEQDQDFDGIAEQYDVPRREANSLIHLIQRIYDAVGIVEPSSVFAHRLRSDLMGIKQTGLVWRWRRLPARVQIAASATLVGGLVLLITRILTGDWRRHREVEEMKVA